MVRTPNYHAARKYAEEAVANPVPVEGIPHEDSNLAGREMPASPAPRGIEPAKWAAMNRRQRRQFKKESERG